MPGPVGLPGDKGLTGDRGKDGQRGLIGKFIFLNILAIRHCVPFRRTL